MPQFRLFLLWLVKGGVIYTNPFKNHSHVLKYLSRSFSVRIPFLGTPIVPNLIEIPFDSFLSGKSEGILDDRVIHVMKADTGGEVFLQHNRN